MNVYKPPYLDILKIQLDYHQSNLNKLNEHFKKQLDFNVDMEIIYENGRFIIKTDYDYLLQRNTL